MFCSYGLDRGGNRNPREPASSGGFAFVAGEVILPSRPAQCLFALAKIHQSGVVADSPTSLPSAFGDTGTPLDAKPQPQKAALGGQT